MTSPSTSASVPNTRNSGFTLVELLIAIILSTMFSLIVLNFMIDFWRGLATNIQDNETLVSREDAGDFLRQVLNPAKGMIDQNSIADSHTLVPDPGDSTHTHWLILHAIPGNTPLPASGSYTPVFYFTAPSVNSAKNFIMNGAQPYYDEFVVYMSGTTKQLLLRTLVNPSATGDYLKTSCPASSATSTCPADADIVDNITSIDTSYYSRSGLTVDYTSSTDPTTNLYDGPDFPTVDVVQLTLHLKRNSVIHNGFNTINQAVIRVALRNS